ncbi:MAG: CoB--CoM heterodisulfide reductase iron-sulfur subunit A family protein, partial [Candidatus Aminicenantes bacterium]|nr:CoB--CoM heterodisulfide reductase iron-sulfur subunit A family protein [Candidatus Aminicenantes bacterium]
SKVFQEDGKLKVWGVDTLTGKKIEIDADMVVLAMAMRPSRGAEDVAKKLKIPMDKDGFLAEAHPKLRPVESVTAGMYLAGAAQAPKDIPEAVAQASGAASKVLALFSSDTLSHNPVIAVVDEELCSGCKLCISMCPYGARVYDAEKKVVSVNDVLCEGCGCCIVACPSGAAQQANFTDEQIHSMVETILEE